MNKKSVLLNILVFYYGIIQTVHFGALIYSSILLQKNGELSLLAQPPQGGWSVQATHFLMATGIVDAVNVLLTFIFLYAFFLNKKMWFWLGSFVTTVSLLSALIYGYGTFHSGAWAQHPNEYILLLILFIPIFLLFGVFAKMGLSSNLEYN